MASLLKQILEEEIEQLRHLQGVMQEERECLLRMDRDDLVRLTGEKEALAQQMRRLNARKERLEGEDEESLSGVPGVSRLFQTRDDLLRELRELSAVQTKIIDTQKEQIGELLSFLQNLRHPSTTYDNKGNFR
jgi:flagellar biosynthesis/type III secretory pathway chaperone